MSIIIKGMEMPKSCGDCPFGRDEDAQYYACDLSEWSVINPNGEELRDDCPLVELPPHGRLIDADAYGKDLRETIDECFKWAEEVKEGEMYARVSQSLATFVECSLRAKSAPTIIEAEGKQ